MGRGRRDRAAQRPTGTADGDDGRVTLADVLGVPRLPPPLVGRGMGRLRAGLHRLHRRLVPPPVQILEAALAGLDLAALAAICRLDLPERLDTPTTVAQLARDLGVDQHRLDRLVRYAVTRGWVRLDAQGRVAATGTTRFLRRDHPGGWRAWVEFAVLPEIAASVGALDAALASDGDAFAAGNGAPFFDWMQANPASHATFDAAMAAGGRMHGLLLARTLDWSGSRRVCDIGGGDGSLLAVLRSEHPHLEGVLLELPEVVDRAPTRPGITAVAGDAFDSVPADCDTYLLVNVVHDWDDDAATLLLTRAAEAAAAHPGPGDGRIVVVEGETPQRPRDDLSMRTDLLMLALTPGGRERSTGELAGLADAAGLRLRRTHALAPGLLATTFTARMRGG